MSNWTMQASVDVCVVGAGPAGLSTALAAARGGASVLVLEAGGADLASPTHPESLDHIVSDSVYSSFPLNTQRAQGVGGTIALWAVETTNRRFGVRLLPLDPIDFAERSWVADSGWPIAHTELLAWYQAAHDAMGLSPARYSPDEFGPTGFDPVTVEGFESALYHFADGLSVRERLLGALRATGRVTVETGTVVTKLVPAVDGSSVAAVLAVRPDGSRVEIPVDDLVLAAGGVENARLLLDDELDGRRLNTARAALGAYFMDHPIVRGGVLDLADGRRASELGFYCMNEVGSAKIMGHLKVSEATQRNAGLLNTAFILLPRPAGYRPSVMQHYKSVVARRDLAELARTAVRGPMALTVRDAVAYAQLRRTGWATLDRGGWTDWPAGDRTFRRFELIQQTETPPLATNRVELIDTPDGLGRRPARVLWEWHESERRSVARSQDLLADAVQRAGIGRFTPERRDGEPVLLSGTHHHMGTTRMHADPKLGVVDSDARVHGVSNLFVAGSSVFTTGGFQNPQLALMALSLRLGDHLTGPARSAERTLRRTAVD